MGKINFTENEIIQERKKRKSRDTGTDASHSHHSESMTVRLTTHGRSWKLYSECKELMLGIPPYWNPNRIFFQSSQASFTLCLINRKSGLKDLEQTTQFIRHTELSKRYRSYVIQNLTSRSIFIISHWFDNLFVNLCNRHEIFQYKWTVRLCPLFIFMLLHCNAMYCIKCIPNSFVTITFSLENNHLP